MSKSVQRGRKAGQKSSRSAKNKSAPVSKDAVSTAAGPEQGGLTREKQNALYDRAMKLFLAGDFAKARDLLDQVAQGPSPEVAHAARMHRSICERRLDSVEVQLENPDDHYNYAVALINRRRLSDAQKHLQKALDTKGRVDHVHYALALCYGLQGDLRKAGDHLQQAIDLDQKNRAAARNDPDFESFAASPAISAILNRGDAD